MYIDIRMKAKTTQPVNLVQIAVKLPLMPGSISTARSTCGKPQCACHQDPAKRHGTYYRWTGVLEGKRTTKTLSSTEARECQARIRNYRELQKAINDLIRQSLKNAPWANR
jgi:hypothetical protein